MPCYAPQTAWKVDGSITFRRPFQNEDLCRLDLPCGQCIGCRQERARQWAQRILHEKKMWSCSVFVTLTYDDKHLPLHGSLNKRDYQLFMKRLRRARRGPVRYYACGEYGELTFRPHFHAILFNCHFGDLRLHSENSRGEGLYVSEELHGLWDNGNCLVGDVSNDSAGYVARYCVKKLGDRGASYEWISDDGEVHERAVEFSLMSRNPGIGAPYYDRYGAEVRCHDSVVVAGREVPVNRFYDGRTKSLDPAWFKRIQAKRRSRALAAAKDNTVDRRRVKEIIALRRLDLKNRGVV